MNSANPMISLLKKLLKQFPGSAKKMQGELAMAGAERGGDELLVGDDIAAQGVVPIFSNSEQGQDSGFRELLRNLLVFDIGELLHPRTFLYLLVFLVPVIFQIYNTLTINSLSLQNEQLREQIQMTSSVITSQELKVHELQSIHNIAKDAAALGLVASRVPAVELDP
ncbi:MAG: hypothetical protein FDX18_09985 [Chlorobium sp.]|nr:MAG: hypothetical protein FDX18_09985 [Chlorobium sp.]